MKNGVLTLLALVVALPVYADPSISSTTGVAAGDSIMVISGSGFGAGGTLIAWDNFEGGVDGAEIAGESPVSGLEDSWYIFPDEPTLIPNPHYSSSRSYAGNKSVKVAWNAVGYSGASMNAFGFIGEGNFQSVFFSYYRYLETSDPNLPSYADMNHKQGYTFSTYENNGPQFLINYIPGGIDHYASKVQNEGDNVTYYWTDPGPLVHYQDDLGTWGKWETYIQFNDPVGSYNGVIQAFYNCVERRHITNGKFSDTVGHNHIHRALLGYMYQGYSQVDSVHSYFDDVYISTSRARVSIGDDNTFDNCTHREIQIPSAWSATEITVTCNQGTFSADETAYLFVVDEDGTASSGYEITWGSDTPIGPATPDPVDSLWVIDQ